jgi:hypothetical protein
MENYIYNLKNSENLLTQLKSFKTMVVVGYIVEYHKLHKLSVDSRY